MKGLERNKEAILGISIRGIEFKEFAMKVFEELKL